LAFIDCPRRGQVRGLWVHLNLSFWRQNIIINKDNTQYYTKKVIETAFDVDVDDVLKIGILDQL